MNNTKKVPESYIPILILRAYDMKLLIHQDSIAASARECFLNRLVARSNTSAEIMPPTEAWLGFGIGHVPYYTDVSEKFMGITLLRTGISFSPAPLGSQRCGAQNTLSVYSQMQATPQLNKARTTPRGFKEALHTTRPTIPTRTCMRLNKHGAFDNAPFEALEYSSEQINRWTVLNRHRRLAPSFVDPYGPADVTVNKERYCIKGRCEFIYEFGVRKEYRIILESFTSWSGTMWYQILGTYRAFLLL